MSTEKYLDKVHETLKDLNFKQLTDARYREVIGNLLSDKFEEVYGTKSISEEQCIQDHGYALVPAILRGRTGTEYVALLDICVMDSGEHSGTIILHPLLGVVEQEEFQPLLFLLVLFASLTYSCA